MRVVDSRGRVFGRINIIDLLVVLFIILVIAVGIKFLFFNGTTVEQKEWITIDIKPNIQEEWYADAVKAVGDGKDFKIIEISVENKPFITVNDEGELLEMENPLSVVVSIKAGLLVTNKDKVMYDNQEIKVGKKIKIKTPTVDIEGVMTKIYS